MTASLLFSPLLQISLLFLHGWKVPMFEFALAGCVPDINIYPIEYIPLPYNTPKVPANASQHNRISRAGRRCWRCGLGMSSHIGGSLASWRILARLLGRLGSGRLGSVLPGLLRSICRILGTSQRCLPSDSIRCFWRICGFCWRTLAISVPHSPTDISFLSASYAVLYVKPKPTALKITPQTYVQTRK